MQEVAAAVGTSLSSVSRVLSGHPDVSPAMRRRVMAAVKELDYEPDFLAQSLRRGATRSVGFVIGDISNPLMADIASGAESVLRRADYSMVLMNSESRPELDASHVRFLLARRVDGLILSLATERDPETTDQLVRGSVPVVAIDRDLPPELQASVVLSDHGSGMTDAVNRLIDLGHRRIALISGSLDLRPGRERLGAVRRTMLARGVADGLITDGGSVEASRAQAETGRILELAQPPTAIIVGGNQLLAGCLRAIRASGRRIGSDISMVTCDETAVVEFHEPPIATVSRDNELIGATAAQLLLERLAGAPIRRVVLPTSFVARASCAPPAMIPAASA
jgi:LacI family transcriptional regulator, galactose operon repressor